MSGGPDRPELIRVGRRDGLPRLLGVLMIAIILAGAAIWKPWESGRPVPATPRSDAAGAVGSLLPAATGRPRGTLGPVGTPPPQGFGFAGLNLTTMGHADPHRDWGVAVAYVPVNQIETATRRGSATVTPVVDWVSIEPGSPAPGPTMDHPGVISVAVAATWPAGVTPRALRLIHGGAFEVVPIPSPDQSPTSPTCCQVVLGTSLLTLVRAVTSTDPEPAPSSGEFFLPAFSPLPIDPAGWLGGGWTGGVYAFEIELSDGTVATLPFRIGG